MLLQRGRVCMCGHKNVSDVSVPIQLERPYDNETITFQMPHKQCIGPKANNLIVRCDQSMHVYCIISNPLTWALLLKSHVKQCCFTQAIDMEFRMLPSLNIQVN